VTPGGDTLPSSFRDPSGFLFRRDGVLYRQVDRSFADHYDFLISSGLYRSLADDGLLIAHEEVDQSAAASPSAHRVLRPEVVEFISYPYEWCFGELKDAALATLEIQRRAMEHGMSLRDASAYNIQFHRGRPTLIDTLSFERLREGEPWVAYRQFCQHFLAPLALMSHRDVRLGTLSRIHLDGVPLDLASELLPRRAKLRGSLLLHLALHAKSQIRHATDGSSEVEKARPARPFTLKAFQGVISSLEGGVRNLSWEPGRSAWSQYYGEAESYSDEALEHKKSLITDFVASAAPATLWDLGSNTGMFSRIAASRGIRTVSFDADPASVEVNYRQVRAEGEQHLLPLVLDVTNPSPAIGWQNRERMSLVERGPADMALALALVHHLAIGNNVPLQRVADWLVELCTWVAVEFVPKSDPKVRTLLATREDIFPGYTQDGFEQAFGQRFEIMRHEPIRDSERTLYLMRRR
jgi:ribosomal protein L11 methylase PrmA